MFGQARTAQNCPFCKQVHQMLIPGVVMRNPMVSTAADTVPDQGYSFCNCKNIFFTDWSNINQKVYNEDYTTKYDTEIVLKMVAEFADRYLPEFIETQGKSFVEIGAANTFVLDLAKERGWETTGVDINTTSPIAKKHNCIIGNVEDKSTVVRMPMADVIWASHIFEHFKEPLTVAKNMYNILNPGGYLLIAMPDPWFIDWSNPLNWGHWHVREHHILWDMDSFIDELLPMGYELHLAKRNTLKYLCRGDMHLIFRKPCESKD